MTCPAAGAVEDGDPIRHMTNRCQDAASGRMLGRMRLACRPARVVWTDARWQIGGGVVSLTAQLDERPQRDLLSRLA